MTLATLAGILRDAGAPDALETAEAALRLFRADPEDPDVEGINELCEAFGIES